MYRPPIFSPSMQAMLFFSLLPLCNPTGAFARAHPVEREPAITRDIDDAGLAWGPCPSFMPDGCAIAVLHGDPGKDNVDVFFKVPGGAMIPLHTHTSAERMVLVAGKMEVTYDGQEAAVLTPGTYGYGPAERPHSGRCASVSPCVLFIAFESPLDAAVVEAAASGDVPEASR